MWKVLAGLVLLTLLIGGLLLKAKEELGELKTALRDANSALGEIKSGITVMQNLSREDQERQTKRLNNMQAQMREIAEYASDNSIDRFELNANWVWLHDVQARGLDPNSAAARNLQERSRVADDIETLGIVGRNYGVCQELRDQVQLCRDWALHEVKRFEAHGK